MGALGKGIFDSAGRKEQDDKIFHHDDWLSLGGLGPGNMSRGFKEMKKGERHLDTFRIRVLLLLQPGTLWMTSTVLGQGQLV